MKWILFIGILLLIIISVGTSVLGAVINPSRQPQSSVRNVSTKEQAIDLVKQQYPEVKNIHETPDDSIGKSMDIDTARSENVWKLVFWSGSGDCPAGCINTREWYFSVNDNGTVEKVGEYERTYNSTTNGYDEKGTRIIGFLNK